MESFKVSRSRYRKVYGLPTYRGMVLNAILIGALYFSVASNSQTERWLFLLMILLILVHLTESSQPFRHMLVQVLPFDPPFEGDLSSVPIQISNQTDFKLDQMWIKFEDGNEWTEVAPIAKQSLTLILLPYVFTDAGSFELPRVVLRTSPRPHLFRYWRIIDASETTFVLPTPVNHHVASKPRSRADDDVELTDLEQIRDERLMPLMDQKLFLKTGLPYRRVHQSVGASEQVSFAWSYLEQLSHRKKGEQFSFWIKTASDAKRNVEVSIDTPFMKSAQNARSMNWRNLKNGFAKWFYAQP